MYDVDAADRAAAQLAPRLANISATWLSLKNLATKGRVVLTD